MTPSPNAISPLLFFLVLPAFVVPSSYGIEITVQPGVDLLPQALAKRRALGFKLEENVNIILEPGEHRLTTPLILGPEDGGDGSYEVKFYGENATISGGFEITGWNLQKGSKNIWEAPFPEVQHVNLTDIGPRMQMWRGTERLQLARSALLRYENCSREWIQFRATDVREEYYQQDDVLLVLYEKWVMDFNRIKTIVPENRTLFFSIPNFSPSDPDGGGSRYYILNAIEHLDEPGEFYMDTAKRKIMLFLEEGDDPNNAEEGQGEGASQGEGFYVSDITSLVELQGNTSKAVSNVTFENLNFAYTSVESFYINAGGYGVWSNMETRNITIASNVLTDLGAGGIRVGRGDAITDNVQYISVSDNVLEDGGHVRGVVAESFSRLDTAQRNQLLPVQWDIHRMDLGVGSRRSISVAVMLIQYSPTVVHDIVIERNYLHDLGLGYLSDMGCVYTLGHQPNSRVSNNLCTDVQSYGYGGWGYYTDEGSRDILFENNVAAYTKSAGLFQHYGTDNVITNSIFYNVNIGDLPTPGRKEIIMNGSADASIRSGQAGREM
eukprot:jgi/Bigna1/71605/fgenesh1_pg.16_\